jgi:hypothetical protein
MSFLFADRKKQIAVVNKPTDSNNSGLFITGSLDLLNQASVTGLASATLVGNLTDAANLIYPTNRGSLTYYDGLVIEGLPHIALSPVMGNVTAGVRDKGVGIGLGFSESVGVRTYTKPAAVLDILGTNADVKITGGALSTSGTASLIMVGSQANPGAVSGFKIDVERTTADPTLSVANMYIKPYNINTDLPALISINHEGNVGIGTSTADATLHIVSSLPSVSAVQIENLFGSGLTIKTGSSVAGSSYPLRIITDAGSSSNDAIALYVNNEGKVGIKVDPTGIVSNVSNNLALAVNGSIRATNIVFAFGTFTSINGIFTKKDTYNVDSITATSSQITINFLDQIIEFDSLREYTVLLSETSGNPVIPFVLNKNQGNVVIKFKNSTDGTDANYTEFSFAIFSNTGSIYQEASLVQAVF